MSTSESYVPSSYTRSGAIPASQYYGTRGSTYSTGGYGGYSGYSGAGRTYPSGGYTGGYYTSEGQSYSPRRDNIYYSNYQTSTPYTSTYTGYGAAGGQTYSTPAYTSETRGYSPVTTGLYTSGVRAQSPGSRLATVRVPKLDYDIKEIEVPKQVQVPKTVMEEVMVPKEVPREVVETIMVPKQITKTIMETIMVPEQRAKTITEYKTVMEKQSIKIPKPVIETKTHYVQRQKVIMESVPITVTEPAWEERQVWLTEEEIRAYEREGGMYKGYGGSYGYGPVGGYTTGGYTSGYAGGYTSAYPLGSGMTTTVAPAAYTTTGTVGGYYSQPRGSYAEYSTSTSEVKNDEKTTENVVI